MTGGCIRELFRGLALMLVVLGWAQSADARALNRAQTLPALPGSAELKMLFTVKRQPVAVTRQGVFVLQENAGRWLPMRGAVATDSATGGADGVMLARGGGDTLADVATANLVSGTVVRSRLPSLPEMVRAPVAAWEGDTLLVGGIGADGRPRLFSHAADQPGWNVQPAWPSGDPAGIAAKNGRRIVNASDGRLWRWSIGEGWRVAAAAPGHVIGSGAPVGQAHLLYVVMRGDAARLYSYDTITDAWADLGSLPTKRPVAVAEAADGLLVAAQTANGPVIWRVATAYPKPGLSLIDEAIVAAYMLAMLGVGIWFYTRTNADSTSEFFLGNRRIPFWAAGLSMFAGTIGSVNYLAYPAKSFETDWQYLMSKATYVGALVVVAIWLAPFFRRLNMVSVNSYLEVRFALGIRLLASALWIILQLTARMGIILYLPSLAIHTMTGIDIVACIAVIGTFTIVYTALGGMKAVVWTDVVQVFVLIGGALFAILWIIWSLGLAQVIDTTVAFHKTRAINLSLDVHQPTIWAFIALAVLEGILCFPRDQIVMQRVLSTSSPKEASWSILTFAAVLLPSAVMFYGIGTALFAFYRAHPASLDPTAPIDAVFPTFIGAELPHGVVGLVVAGVLAAAMGVLSGIINSVATLLSIDFYDRFMPNRTQRQIVRFSEIVSVLVGLIGIGIAILLSRLNIHSLLDLTIELGGVFGGSFAGAFPLGVFTRRANWQGAAVGIAVSAAVTLAVWSAGAVHPYLYLAIAIFVSLTVGYLASLFFPPPAQSLDGLTVFTQRPAVPAASPRPA